MHIHIYPIGAITKGQKGNALSEIGGMVSEGIVAISDDGVPVSNSQVLRSALEYSKKFNRLSHWWFWDWDDRVYDDGFAARYCFRSIG